jgi:hypothetical protein
VLRAILVVIHASAGVGGLVTGLAALAPPRPDDGRRWIRRLYLLFLAVLLISMVVLVAMDWNDLDVAARVAFGALIALGAAMAVRISLANRAASGHGADWRKRYIGHVYFTYISLWEGFVILPALNLPLPQVSVPLVAVSVLLIGHTLIARYEARVLAT